MPATPIPDLDRPARRVLQYELADGTYEFFFAVVFLLLAGISYAQAFAPGSLWSDLLAGPGLLIFLPGAGLLLDRLVRRFRERVTFPRTGYLARKTAAETSPRLRRAIWIGVPTLSIALLVVLSFYRPVLVPVDPGAWMEVVPVFPSFFSMVLGGLWAILAWRLRLPRFYLIALLTWLVGTAIFLSRMGSRIGMAAFCAATALVLAVSAAATLLTFLHRNPLPGGGAR